MYYAYSVHGAVYHTRLHVCVHVHVCVCVPCTHVGHIHKYKTQICTEEDEFIVV